MTGQPETHEAPRLQSGTPGDSLKQRCISGDSHLDLSWLPPKLFVENATAAFRDRMPQQYIEKLFGHLSPEDRDKVTYRNAAGLYGLAV